MVSSISQTVAASEKVGVKIEWLDQLAELHEETGRVQQILEEVCFEKSTKTFLPAHWKLTKFVS